LRPPEVGRWHWFYTRTAPPRHPAEADCQWFTADDYDAITSLLDEAFPNASKRPADTAGNRQWFGARDADGTIVACGMVTVGDGVGPMLGSIAVHPRARRRGLGSAVTSWVTRQLLDEGHPMCALGSYAGEEATHRLYRRLGYHDSRILASGNLRNCPN
ncbi:MAG: GNAT family N-acetyltransferase, partial [Stackebrandtia sp.]